MIGGNIIATLQVCTTTRNEIGQTDKAWHDVVNLVGWLDLQGGDARYTYNAKMQESTHVFVSDYVAIPDTLEVEGKMVKVNAESTRLVANSQRYDVKLIDNPMGRNRQLEIYLSYTGGQ